jgi:aminoglycoside phosphotransferase family enzyme/predicted kinase
MSTLKEDLAAGLELIETHISWVFLGREKVWKVKKPVNLGFLDFSTLDKRRAACDAEVQLNSRLAPGVYRGVVPVTRDSRGKHRLGGEGEPVDWAVEMVRLPDARRADRMLRDGRLTSADVDRLADLVARFHERMDTNDHVAAFGSPAMISTNIRENFDQASSTLWEHLGAAEIAEIEAKQTRFVEEHQRLLVARMWSGRVRDGHGDLRFEHVYFTGEEPVIIDCIEFNERFRYADLACDLAFLTMDAASLGRVDVAERLLAAYARASGDYDIYRLIDFYEGYRAFVRGKVSSMLAADAGAEDATRARAAREARRHYLLALSAGRRPLLDPVVVAVGGVIASGKSTVADRLGEVMPAPVVDSDRTRKSLLGVTPTTHLREGAWSGAYAPSVTSDVYEEMFRRARAVLASGRPVILDASFRTRALRSAARTLAVEHNVPFFFVETRVDAERCRERLRRRERMTTVSDGRLEIFDAFVARWEPVTELPPEEHLVLDTSLPVDANLVRLAETLPSWPPLAP